jgi:hypothetical protein
VGSSERIEANQYEDDEDDEDDEYDEYDPEAEFENE